MTAVKVPFRLKAGDLSFGEAFQARYQARVDRPIEDLDLDELFRDIQDNLRPGDWITVVAYRDKQWKQVMEGRTAIITTSQPEAAGGRKVTRAVWMDDLFKVPAASVLAPVGVPKLKLTVKREFGGGFTVQDERGHVLISVKTKKEADDYIENLNGKPEVKAA
jgi:hypothetical protein